MRIQTPLPESFTTASLESLHERIGVAKATLGEKLLILGHHYQRDEVMEWADLRGDSFGLSRMAADHAAQHPETELVVFCGVHFMAESADILTPDHVRVFLPDLNAGCSMADMADVESVEQAWAELAATTDISKVIPITYMNSSAALKAFVGRNGGAVCTSSNARAVLEWALHERDANQVLFFPDQHLGRNTGLRMARKGDASGALYGHDDMRVWNPRLDLGGLTPDEAKNKTFLLWKGFCSIHQRFTAQHVLDARAQHPGVIVIAHPETPHEVCDIADQVGSTDYIIRAVDAAPEGSVIAVATEIHLVQRLAREAAKANKTVFSLDPLICPCSTMFRIDAPHLCWTLENLVAGNFGNEISVDPDVARDARIALQRMLDIV